MPLKPGENLETFSGRLAYLLNAKRISQVMLAQDLDATQSTISRWLKGSMPDPKFAVALSKRLNVPLVWLLYGAAEKPSELEAFLTEMREHRIPRIDAAIREFSEGRDANLEPVIDHVHSLREIRESLINTADYAQMAGYPIGGGFIDRPDYSLPPPDKTRMTWGDLHDWICEMWGLPLSTSMEELAAIARSNKEKKYAMKFKARPAPKEITGVEKSPQENQAALESNPNRLEEKSSTPADFGPLADFVKSNLSELRRVFGDDQETLKNFDELIGLGTFDAAPSAKLGRIQLKKLMYLLRSRLADPDLPDSYKFDGPVPPILSNAASTKSRSSKK